MKGPTVAETDETKYFRLDGGSTVLQNGEEGWQRWDHVGGLVSTHIPWNVSDPRLAQITIEEAIALMK